MKNGLLKTQPNYRGKMEKRIKIFTDQNAYDLEKVVNNFLEHIVGKLHDVIFDVAFDPHVDGLEYTSVLVYTPEGESQV